MVGYHRPVKNWNKGKQEEFKDRKLYRQGSFTQPGQHTPPAAPENLSEPNAPQAEAEKPVTREQLPPEKKLSAAVPAVD